MRPGQVELRSKDLLTGRVTLLGPQVSRAMPQAEEAVEHTRH